MTDEIEKNGENGELNSFEEVVSEIIVPDEGIYEQTISEESVSDESGSNETQNSEGTEGGNQEEPSDGEKDTNDENLSDDLYELVKSFPNLRTYSDISDIPKWERYAELRSAGLSPEEAYLAVNGRAELDLHAEVQRIQRGQSEQKHMKAAVSGGATPKRLMSEAQRRSARATIGTDISDAELDALWKKVFGED